MRYGAHNRKGLSAKRWKAHCPHKSQDDLPCALCAMPSFPWCEIPLWQDNTGIGQKRRFEKSRTVFRGPDFVSGQGARRRKSAAYISYVSDFRRRATLPWSKRWAY